MTSINDYINDEQKTINVDRYLKDTEEALKEKGITDKKYAYAIVVLKINYEVSTRPWLSSLGLLLALQGYTNTIRELTKILGGKDI